MNDYSEERLGVLIGTLAPAPAAWVEAAIALPRARAAIDDLAARATADAQARAKILAALEDALRGAGVEPHPSYVERLRARLSEPAG
jgi:hypothetical protein